MVMRDFTKILRRLYPEAQTALRHKNAFQLLVATILSAQCTDERVNKVTPALFKKYPDPAAFASASRAEVEDMVRSTGFYRNKANSIIESSKTILQRYAGKVPATTEELLTLRGVARKTANVVLGSAFGIASGIVVDTHVKRLAFRMGFTKSANPEKIEIELMALLEKKDWIWFSSALILHGRKVCKAINPDCPGCRLNIICPRKGVAVKN